MALYVWHNKVTLQIHGDIIMYVSQCWGINTMTQQHNSVKMSGNWTRLWFAAAGETRHI